MVAKPKTDRWHKKPTAMLGGVAIWLAVVVSYLVFIRPAIAGLGSHFPSSYLDVVIGASTFLFLVGLADDFLHTKPYQKLIGQVMGSAFVVYYGLSLAVDRLLSAERGADDLLVDRDHERGKPARQHGWPRGRHRDHRLGISGAQLSQPPARSWKR